MLSATGIVDASCIYLKANSLERKRAFLDLGDYEKHFYLPVSPFPPAAGTLLYSLML